MFAFFRNESKAFCDNRDLDETEKLIQFAKPFFNDNISAIEH
jgi:hypothetical protein